MDDDGIRSLIGRLARPDGSGGHVIERSAILAAGSDSSEILAWIEDHGGRPEALVPAISRGGLHGGRVGDRRGTDPTNPRRYVLPPNALG